MSDDDFVNEPVVTGWVRTELQGDSDAAKLHIREARRLLGGMKTYYGVQERLAKGEPGGFYSKSHQLADGSVIDVMTNDGMDTIRIRSPKTESFASSSSELVGEGEQKDAVATEGGSDYQHIEAPDTPPPPEREPPKKPEPGEKKVDSYKPYLWIGVRTINGSSAQLHACVWEYANNPATAPVILSNRNDVGGGSEDASVFPLGPWTQFMPAGDDTGIAYTDDKLFMLLERNGLSMSPPDSEGDDYQVVFISDPDNDLALTTPDGPMEGKKSGGEYMLKVMALGPDCGPARHQTVEVEVRIITGKDGYEDDKRTTFTIGQGTNYKMGIMPMGYYTPPPTPPTGTPAEISCSTCDEAVNDSGANPHGPHWWQGAGVVYVAPEQTDVPADQVILSTTTLTDRTTLPPTGFSPGSWWSYADLCPACESWTTRYGGAGASGFITQLITGMLSCTGFPFGGGPHPGAISHTYSGYVRPTFPSAATIAIFNDYGLSTSATVTDQNGAPVGEVNFAPEGDWGSSRDVFKDSKTYQMTEAEGAYCFAGFWFPGPPTAIGSMSDPEFFAMLESDLGYDYDGIYAAHYKYTVTTDQHGNESKTAQWISRGEYENAPNDLDGPPGTKIGFGCVRVGRDD